ncbi:aminomethyltransferase [Desulfomicrobium apsheronum]|uniref:aminomethyltransferase n=1 Tax=Desulfomicrobium apsheronum TaxID=52560 RepID=A0A1I3QLS8_9BACT|nr:glycine cleavage system aminomethyltransferase GcvT [Desulfomicrobium apsheronum]SFJ34482.1 aminomethyltransferase [Desulfomicrobium apsheronum]
MSELLTTPLHAWHKNNGARMVPFAGWDMPVQYVGILEEHKHTRTHASIFDISHMGEFLLEGDGATEALATVVTHNLATLAPGKCRYGFLLNEKGGVLDDLIVYRLDTEKYMLVVNGACIESDFAWIKSHLPASLTLIDQSFDIAKIDLQGPESFNVLARVMPGDWTGLGYFAFREVEFEGFRLIVSRTGYTGELGCEFYLPWDKAEVLWEKLMADETVRPAGLGARDTLRLEVGLPLYGQDLDTQHTPVEAGYGGMLKSEAEYIGKSGLGNMREKLIGLRIDGRRSARHHDEVFVGETKVGTVTSGSIAPSLGYCVAMAFVREDMADAENFTVKGPRTTLEATRADMPFYTAGTARRKLS